MIGVVVDLPSVWYLAALKYIDQAKFAVAGRFPPHPLLRPHRLYLVELPLLFNVKWPQQTQKVVQSANNWVKAHQRIIAAGIAGVIGIWQLSTGLPNLERSAEETAMTRRARVATGGHHHILGRVRTAPGSRATSAMASEGRQGREKTSSPRSRVTERKEMPGLLDPVYHGLVQPRPEQRHGGEEEVPRRGPGRDLSSLSGLDAPSPPVGRCRSATGGRAL